MDNISFEYHLVLAGWLIAVLLGTFLLFIKTPNDNSHSYYRKGKNTCAAAILLFGLEIFFQWLIRFHLKLEDPMMSVSAYLLTFCAATLLFSMGFCNMMAPKLMDRRQYWIAAMILMAYFALLATNYFFIPSGLQLTGIIVCCMLLFIITCIAIYKCIMIYRRAISDLRRYYSDFVENLMRWMPGVGVGITLFLLTAPFTCLGPRWAGIYQMALGIIMFIYTFICTINFSFSYSKMADAIIPRDDTTARETEPGQVPAPASTATGSHPAMSDSLREVMKQKEQRWREQGRYRVPGITIEHAARDMNTNRNYLSTYLNEVKHVTFYEWVASLRVDEAKSLMLASREMSIEQIASAVGFTSASTFSSTFKKMEGISPSKWRNNQ